MNVDCRCIKPYLPPTASDKSTISVLPLVVQTHVVNGEGHIVNVKALFYYFVGTVPYKDIKPYHSPF